MGSAISQETASSVDHPRGRLGALRGGRSGPWTLRDTLRGWLDRVLRRRRGEQPPRSVEAATPPAESAGPWVVHGFEVPEPPDGLNARMRLGPMLGGELRHARESQGLTLAQVEDRVGASAGHISNLERGSAAPSLKLAERLARALDLTSDGEAALLAVAGEVERRRMDREARRLSRPPKASERRLAPGRRFYVGNPALETEASSSGPPDIVLEVTPKPASPWKSVDRGRPQGGRSPGSPPP